MKNTVTRSITALFAMSVALLYLALPIQAIRIEYEYDALDRLAKVVYPTGEQICYAYDAVGNRTRKLVALAEDSDCDGMPNSWELAYGLNSNNPADADEDPDQDNLTCLQEYRKQTNPKESDTDGDGMNDGDEIFAGTDPTDPDIVFKVNLGESGLTFEWTPTPGKRYQVYFSDDLQTWSPLGDPTPASPSDDPIPIVDPGAPAEGIRFYKVEVLP